MNHDPEAFLAQNAGNGLPVAASDVEFAVLEAAASFAAHGAASFAVWLDATRVAALTVSSVSSAAGKTGDPERVSAEWPAPYGDSAAAVAASIAHAVGQGDPPAVARVALALTVVHVAAPSHQPALCEPQV